MFRSLDVITEVEWVKEHLFKKENLCFLFCLYKSRKSDVQNGGFKSTVVNKVKLKRLLYFVHRDREERDEISIGE
jgi:hypothetical protein